MRSLHVHAHPHHAEEEDVEEGNAAFMLDKFPMLIGQLIKETIDKRNSFLTAL